MRNKVSLRQAESARWDLEARLVRYGAMAAAVALGGGTAEGAIVFHSGGDTTTTGTTNVRFDLISGAVSTSTFSQVAPVPNLPSFGALFVLQGGDFGGFYYAGVYQDVGGASGTGGILGATFSSFTFWADRLQSSSNVGPGNFGSFAVLAKTDSSTGNFYPFSGSAQRGFIGLRFSFDGGVNRHYGWADITVNPDFTVTLHGFAFENCANEPIHAGSTSGGATCSSAPIPEPHSAALVALGAAGLLAYRRRRKGA